MIFVEGHPTISEQEEKYKERLRQYGKEFSLEKLRDSYLDSVRLINEVLEEDNKK